MSLKNILSEKKDDPDLNLFLTELDRLISGDYSDCDVSEFTNPVYGEKLNILIHNLKINNNDYAMRLNTVLKDVADNSYIKNMIDHVNNQTDTINSIKNSGENLDNSIDNISNEMANIKEKTQNMLTASKTSTEGIHTSMKIVNTSSEQITNINSQFQNFRDKINEIGNVIDVVKKIANQSNLLALNASVEAARAGESGRGFAVVADSIRQLSINTTESSENIIKYVSELNDDITTLAETMNITSQHLEDGNQMVEKSLSDMNSINEQLSLINDAINNIFNDVDTQQRITREFTSLVGNISDSYTSLYNECMNFGTHIYKDGRYLDRARTDLLKGFSDITPVDWLHIFETDHFVLMWRVYSNIVDLEQLQLKQLNRPGNCKLGKWLIKNKDTSISETTEYKNLYECHENFHIYATKSFEAKQNDNIDEALNYFNKTFEEYNNLKKYILAIVNIYKRNGYTTFTELHPIHK